MNTTEVEYDPAKTDLGELAKAAAAAQTPHAAKGTPSATLVLTAAKVTDEQAGKVADALGKIKGVDAAKSKADPKTSEVRVKLDDKGGAKLADIKAALKDAGIEVK
jgi:copper chaperone CopZ